MIKQVLFDGKVEVGISEIGDGNKFLPEVAKEQLAEAGVLLENIIDFKVDTVGSVNLPSHSSGDKTQRFAIVVRQN